jgi:4-hydroxy-tetrahydrodipicolinate reductase
MGLALVQAISKDASLQLGAAVDRAGPAIGRDAGVLAGTAATGVMVTSDLPAASGALDVVIDFSRADAVPDSVATCVAAGVPMLIGTTGLSVETQSLIDAAAQRIPILVSANTSLALNVLLELVRRAAQALPGNFDIEIFEAHHRHKVDAPSGTALVLAEAAASGRGVRLPRPVSLTGAQAGARAPGGIGFSVVRGGDVVGEHEVRFLGVGEQLRLGHIATDRSIFAHGALAAALWLVGRPRGRYGMADFLFKEQ